MSIEWKTVMAVVIALILFKVLDKLILDSAVSKIGNFEDFEE